MGVSSTDALRATAHLRDRVVGVGHETPLLDGRRVPLESDE